MSGNCLKEKKTPKKINIPRRKFLKTITIGTTSISLAYLLSCFPIKLSKLPIEKTHQTTLLGMIHFTDMKSSKQEIINKTKTNKNTLKSYNKALEAIKRLPAGSRILIEDATPFSVNGKKYYSIFSVLSEKARAKGLIVENYLPRKAIFRRIDAYSYLIETFYKNKNPEIIKARKKELAKKYNLSSIKNINSVEEASTKLYQYFEHMTNFLIKSYRKKPALIIAGDLHVAASKKWLKNAEDITPKNTRKYTEKIMANSKQEFKELVELFEKHREKMVKKLKVNG